MNDEPKTAKITEAEIQYFLYLHFSSGRQYGIPNIYLYEWESDFLSVTRAGRVHEYEIKISKADFNADAVKVEKHQIMETGVRNLNKYEQSCFDDGEKYGFDIPSFISSKMTADKKMTGKRPNYFWYVCPEGIITEPPSYAGLIYYSYCLKIIKEAPLLHKEKITQGMERKILTSFYYRYWQLRRNNKAESQELVTL